MDDHWIGLSGFGFGGISGRDLVTRATIAPDLQEVVGLEANAVPSLHDYLGLSADDLPSFPFPRSVSWNSFMEEATRTRLRACVAQEALSLACGLRFAKTRHLHGMKPEEKEVTGSTDYDGELKHEVSASPFADLVVDNPEHTHATNENGDFGRAVAVDAANSSSTRCSFSSCHSKEDEIPNAPTKLDQPRANADLDYCANSSSERSRTCEELSNHESISEGDEGNAGNSEDQIGQVEQCCHGNSADTTKAMPCRPAAYDTGIDASCTQRDIRSHELPNTKARIVAPPSRCRADWWDVANVRAIRYFENSTPFTRLIDARNIKDSHSYLPWLEGRSSELYAEMGVIDPERKYLAFWLNLGINAMLFTSEVLDTSRLDNLLDDDPWQRRLKLLLHPVRVSLPFPAKSAKDADFAGPFFGEQSVYVSRFRTICGADVTVVQLDLFSKWLIKTAISTIGFRPNNIVEMCLVDWLPDNPAALSACKITVTEEFGREFFGR